MRTDHNCFRTFIKLRSIPWVSVNDNWNIQINPLAAPLFQPSFFDWHGGRSDSADNAPLLAGGFILPHLRLPEELAVGVVFSRNCSIDKARSKPECIHLQRFFLAHVLAPFRVAIESAIGTIVDPG